MVSVFKVSLHVSRGDRAYTHTSSVAADSPARAGARARRLWKKVMGGGYRVRVGKVVHDRRAEASGWWEKEDK